MRAVREFRSPIYPADAGGDNVGAGDTLMAGILTWLADHDALAPEELAALDAGCSAADAVVRRRRGGHQLQPGRGQSADARRGGCGARRD